MIQIILGQYLNNSVKLIILSNRNYSKVNIIVNDKNIKSLDIKSYQVNNFVLDDIITNDMYEINFVYKDKILDKINLDLTSNPFDNVLVVNCDSCYGYETGTWDLIPKTLTHIIFHLGDQIYNDHLFYSIYNEYNNNIDKNDEIKIFKKCYYHYLHHFSRNNKKNVLKNNFNLMIPDDHEILDNSINSMKNMHNYKVIKKIFTTITNQIEINLMFGKKKKVLYVEDNKNSTVYVLNYQLDFTKELFEDYNYLQYIKKYDNIIFLNRKCAGTVKNGLLNQLVFKCDPIESVDIDFLLEIKSNKKYLDKKIFILCGDYHMKNTLKYYKDKNKLLTIKNVGAINTVIDIFGVNFIPNSSIKGIELESETIRQNGFVSINYSNGKIKVKDIINKKNILFHLMNSIVSAKEFISMKC
jgi:hypothetical protein